MKPTRKGARRLLMRSAAQYHQTLLALPRSHTAWQWLEQNVVDHERVVERFQLGWVDKAFAEEHSYCTNRLAIPNITVTGSGEAIVVGLKFRSLSTDQETVKFYYPKHQEVRLYDLRSLKEAGDVIALAEGESDTWAGWAAGIPTVGVPGAETFGKDSYRLRLFAGFSRVLVFKDSDDAGQSLVDALVSIDGLEVIEFGEHKDARAFLRAEGVSAFQKRLRPRAHDIEEDM